MSITAICTSSTEYSFDAFAFGTLATPRDAYRYAKGEAILHPAGYEIKLSRPLDFYAVTDHAMFLGVAKEAADTSSELSRLSITDFVHDLNAPNNRGLLSLSTRAKVFGTLVPAAHRKGHGRRARAAGDR